MGRLLLLLLIIVAIVLLWKAFGPSAWNKRVEEEPVREIKGPDDDEEFLWNLEKEAFKQRREKERLEEERRRREQKRED